MPKRIEKWELERNRDIELERRNAELRKAPPMSFIPDPDRPKRRRKRRKHPPQPSQQQLAGVPPKQPVTERKGLPGNTLPPNHPNSPESQLKRLAIENPQALQGLPWD